MIRNRAHIISLLVFCCGYLQGFTQSKIKATVDRTTILVGEPIKLTLEASLPSGNHINWFKIDSIPHFEMLELGVLDSSDDTHVKTYRQLITLTSYDSGYWAIPSFRLQTGKQKLKTDTIPINITYSPADPNQDYHDIKEIIDVPKPSRAYLYWILGAATLLVAAAAVYYFRNKKKPVKPPEQAVSKLTPFEEAMQSLDRLSKQQPAGNLEVKNYFTGLNDVLRTYLRRRFNFSTLAKTNEELILQLRGSKLPGEEFSRLAQALRMNDFVKFAKYIPSEMERKELFDITRHSIKLLEQLNSPA